MSAEVRSGPTSEANEPTVWTNVRAALWAYRLPILLLGGLVALLYRPVVGYDFVTWDDPWYIVRNPHIQSWHPEHLWAIATEPIARNFAPLTIFTFLVEHTLWGLWPGGYHATNVLLHAMNAVLVFVLLRQVTGRAWIGWAAAVLFAVHPVQVESVAWISSRKTLLAAAFTLASLICWLKRERTGRDEAWGMLWLVLGLLCKVSTVVVPPIVFVFDVLVRRRDRGEAIVRQVVPAFFCAMFVLMTASAQFTYIGGIRGHFGMNKLQLLAVDAVILWKYIGMLIAPLNLAVLYDPPTDGIAVQMGVSIAGWLLVAWLAWRERERRPMVTFAAAAWLLLLLPMLNLFPLTTLMNDRYLYLPCIVFFAVAAVGMEAVFQWAVTRLSKRKLEAVSGIVPRTAGILLLIAIGGTYACLTTRQLPVWRDGASLWSHARDVTPSLTVVHIEWANVLHDRGRDEEACAVLVEALEQCRPDAADRERIRRKLSEWRTESAGHLGAAGSR
ncbi:MAG: hypothetical protein ACF8TS_10790 [Maioricimonas sp. JB049]